jgi:hypothetical protein
LSSAHATSLALLAMQKAHAMVSRIINVASAHGWSRPLKNQPMSPPARSGRADQSHFWKNATSGVTCNAICPWLGADTAGPKATGRQQPPLASNAATAQLLGEKEPSCSSPP